MRHCQAYFPSSLRDRVSGTDYTWKIFFGTGRPIDSDGRLGDVWIDVSRDSPSIYIKGTTTPAWDSWRKKKKLKPLHSWLRQRSLQFNGRTLGWYHEHKLKDHRKWWDTEKKEHRAVPSYKSLGIGWIAHYLAQSQTPPLIYDSPLLGPVAIKTRSASPGMYSVILELSATHHRGSSARRR